MSAILYVFAGIAIGGWCGCILGYRFGVSTCRDLYRSGKLPESFTEGSK